jgi:HEAT repeat protein
VQARAALLIAVRTLTARGVLPVETVASFLETLDPARSFDLNLQEQLKQKLTRLVDAAAAGATEAFVRDRVAEVIAFVYERRQDFNLRVSWKGEALDYMRKLLAGLPEKRGDAGQRQALVNTLFQYLSPVLQYDSPLLDSGAPDGVPLEETLIVAAVKTQQKALLDKLCAYLTREDYEHAAFTCLALGQAKDKSVGKTLLRCLASEDGYVRLCAYRSLRRLTGKDFFVDYLYGGAMEWAEAVNEYQKAL